MSAVYSLVVTRLEADATTGVVTSIGWTMTAVDGAYQAEAFGVADLGPPSQPMTPWASITEPLALSWLQAAMDASGQTTFYQALLAQSIADLKTPDTLAGLPWAS